MENESATLENLLTSWTPIILVIGFWIFFMRRMGEPERRLMERSVQFMDRSEQLLERVVAALEKHNGPVGS